MLGGEMMNAIKLNSVDLDKISEKLQQLVAKNANVSELAYAGNMNAVARCSCEKGCEGCTSW